MEKENRFLLLLGALSLFSLAVFQGTQLLINHYSSDVLGISWGNIFGNFGGGSGTGGGGSMPVIPTIPPIPTISFDQNNWQNAMNQLGGNKTRAFAQGIPCDMADSIYDLFCSGVGGTITTGGVKDVLVPTVRAQYGSGGGGGYLNKYLPSGIPQRPTGVNAGGLLGQGLSCETIAQLLDTSTYCADGYISKEEIRTIVGQLRPSSSVTRNPSRVPSITPGL